MKKDNPFGIKVYDITNKSIEEFLSNSITVSDHNKLVYKSRWVNFIRYGIKLTKIRKI